MAELDQLCIQSIQNEKDSVVKDFLQYCVPSSVRYFLFNWNTGFLTPFEWYSDQLLSVFPRVTETIRIENMELTAEDLQGMIRQCKQSTMLEVFNCILPYGVKLDFGENEDYR